jgi:hypothetical protein
MVSIHFQKNKSRLAIDLTRKMREVSDKKGKLNKEILDKLNLDEDFYDPTTLIKELDGYKEEVIPAASELIKLINEDLVNKKDRALLKMLLDYHQAILHLRLEG